MVSQALIEELTPEQAMERLILALDGAGIGVWDWDLRDDRVSFDERWCGMLGLDRASTPMTIDTWASRVHPDDLARCQRDIADHIEGRTARYENVHRMRHADGRWLSILDRGRISGRDEAGRPIRFTGTHADVTEIEHAKADLFVQQQRLTTLIDNLPTGVALFGPDLALRVSNRTWLGNFGLPLDMAVWGRAVEELLPSPGCVSGLVDAIRRAREFDGSAGTTHVVGRDGVARWLRWQIRAWGGMAELEGGVLCCTEDVTLQVESRQAVERERSARIAHLSLFAGGIAHELNSPLQIILTEAELLAEQLAVQQTSEAQAERRPLLERSVESIATTARRASAIARALRTIARDSRGDPPVSVSVDELLRDVSALCSSRVTSSGLELTIASHGEALAVRGRQADLLHALLNLVHRGLGARKGTRGWIRIEVERRDRLVVIRVSDGGESGPKVGLDASHDIVDHRIPPTLDVVSELVARNDGTLVQCDDEAHVTFELALPAVTEGGGS